MTAKISRLETGRAPSDRAGEPSDLPDGRVAFYRVGEQAVGGWIIDPESPQQRFVVDIRVDGESAALALAESFVPELRQRFGGDGCHGFLVPLDPERTADAT